MCSVNTISPNP
uniref:Uncharacterized protein n=1 Tax=Anguilla anguilla TaxID=7936 RepID=A0A0E9WGQ7_ANGAN